MRVIVFRAKQTLAAPLIVLAFALIATAAQSAHAAAAARATPTAAPNPTNSNGLSARLRWVTFNQRSPLSATDQVFARLGRDFRAVTPTDLARSEYDLAREPFGIFVPPAYRPETAHGLFVWVGVTEASPQWLDVLAQHKLIFVTALHGGEGQALDAVFNLKQLFNVESSRIYVCGFSAGGERAAEMLRSFPDVFSGGVFLMGGYFYRSLGDEHARGKRREPSTIVNPTAPWLGEIEQIRKNIKIVIVRAQDDPSTWWAEEGQSDFEALTLDGFVRVRLFVLPHWGHVHPDAYWFEKAIAALESPPRKPPTTSPTRDPHPQPAQMAQARRILTSAQLLLAEKLPREQQARIYLQQVLDDYPTTPAAATARQMLAQLDRQGATTQRGK